MKNKFILTFMGVFIGLLGTGIFLGVATHQVQAMHFWQQERSNRIADENNQWLYRDNASTIIDGNLNITLDIDNSDIMISSLPTETFSSYLPCIFKDFTLCPFYIDDFSDPASGWPIDEDNIAKYAYLNGEYQILVKPSGYVAYTYGDFISSLTFRLEVDARPSSHVNGVVGLIFNRNANGFFAFLVSEDWYTLERYDEASGYWTSLIGWSQSPALNTGFASNHLEVFRNSLLIQLYGNDQYLMGVSDLTYLGPGYGMVAGAFDPGYDARFDNIRFQTQCLDSQANQIPFINGFSFNELKFLPLRLSIQP
jgi:hypothetical protein